MSDFYRFTRMEDGGNHLYLESVMEAERPWWDEEGKIICPENFRLGMEAAGDGLLTIHLNSPGGDLSAGIAIYEMLSSRKGRTRCEISYAASAATLIPCACDESYISQAGVVMLHNPSIAVLGDEEELERASRAIKAWKQAAIAAYKTRIKRTEEEISLIMSQESWYNAQAAVDLGLCDGILDHGNQPKAMSYTRQAVMLVEQDGLKKLAQSLGTIDEERERQALLNWAKE